MGNEHKYLFAQLNLSGAQTVHTRKLSSQTDPGKKKSNSLWHQLPVSELESCNMAVIIPFHAEHLQTQAALSSSDSCSWGHKRGCGLQIASRELLDGAWDPALGADELGKRTLSGRVPCPPCLSSLQSHAGSIGALGQMSPRLLSWHKGGTVQYPFMQLRLSKELLSAAILVLLMSFLSTGGKAFLHARLVLNSQSATLQGWGGTSVYP